MTGSRFIPTLLLSLLAFDAAAAPTAMVDGVQSPAWLLRNGKRQPLAVGIELRIADEILTGVNSRAVIHLADGSAIKLGDNGTLQMQDFAVVRATERVLRATLKVVEGAFRLTTAALQRSRYRRDISVQFTTLSAGIRGTDIWGKNFGDREVAVLIEGQVTVSRANEIPVEMRHAMTYFLAPAAGAARIQPIPPELLQEWAQQTELQANRGAMSSSGKWKLDIARFDNQADALALYDSLERDGYPARILPLAVDGGHVYIVRLDGFANDTEAGALGERLREAYPALQPVPTRR